MADKLFKPDYTKKRFTITIEVYENGQVFNVDTHEPDNKGNYYEVVGAIEAMKVHVIGLQGMKNRKEYKKQNTL